MYVTPASPVTSALIVGPVVSPADVERLRDLARNVAYETGRPATVATSTDIDVRDFSALHSVCDFATLVASPVAVLVGEAMLAGLDVHDPLTADEVRECGCGLVGRATRLPVDEAGEVWCNECTGSDACAWCLDEFDEEDAVIVESGATFYPVHAGCAAAHARRGLPVGILPVAA